MKTILRSLTLALAVGGAMLAVPAMASAETICVNAGAACPAGGTVRITLQDALTTAGNEEGSDEILLGDKLTPYFGPFTYTEQFPSRTKALTVRGVGGRPSLTGPGGDTVLTLRNARLENVELLADFGEGTAATFDAVDMKHVKITGPAGFSPDNFGPLVRGPATLEDVEVTGGFQDGIVFDGSPIGGDDVSARGIRMHDGVAIGARIRTSARVHISDSRIDAVDRGIATTGSVDLRRSVVTTSAPDSLGVSQFDIAAGPLELDHVTLAHVGSPSGADTAFLLRAGVPVDSHLHAVAIAGYTRGFNRPALDAKAPENVVISDSSWNPSKDQLPQGAGVFVEQRNAHTAPAMANLAGGDLHPRAGSSAIDRDEVTDLDAFVDLEGAPALDGNGDGVIRPDAGAFEFRPAAAPAPGGGGDAGNGTPAGDVTKPKLSRLRLVGKGRLKLAFTASEAATIRIQPRRVVRGRAAKARRAIVRRVVAGRGSIVMRRGLRRAGVLRPGTLRLVVTATDPAGNRSAKKVLRLRLRG